MSGLSVPVRTGRASARPFHDDAGLHPLDWTLYGTIDGRRNVVQLESVAKAIGLDAAALARLEARGLIAYEQRVPRPGVPPRWPCEHDD
ncbi:hypothetical protein [Piscinibacter koreensis]|uniref:Uncharacterized protein n=1 Tax=Piscinibacter koreensis TaxID=2742824 RepID=A0A7Y6NNK7_9BURK|nr:hypothetical protein [Schlegelella koreensis]NUZ06492.1 hypothetical protein [Schlegelella koreensis]